ncbi:MAG: hypothetical protein J5843_03540, partial [Clostridia bacterium]|nr:hypothetical protein [Clostridia bacterium]
MFPSTGFVRSLVSVLLVLCIVFSVFCLSGCGNPGQETSSSVSISFSMDPVDSSAQEPESVLPSETPSEDEPSEPAVSGETSAEESPSEEPVTEEGSVLYR